MSDLNNFVSGTEIDRKREETKAYLKEQLREAEDEYRRKEAYKQRHKDRGNDTWLAPGVLEKLGKQEEKDRHNIGETSSKSAKKNRDKDYKKDDEKRKRRERDAEKKHKHDRKSRKEKKSKSHKKHKKSSRVSHSLSSGSDSDSQKDDWIEEDDTPAPTQPHYTSENKKVSEDIREKDPKNEPSDKSGPVQRESWMLRQPPRTVAQATAVDEPHTTATDTVREDTNTQKEAMFDKPGGHARELNKFWKANGTGMPEAAQATATKREAMMRSMEADRHKHTHATKGPALSWRQKALARLKSKDSQSQIDSGRTDTTVESDTGQAVIMATHSANESSVSNANELATSMSNSLRNRMRATVRKTADHSDTLKSTEDNTTESQSTETPAEQPVEPEMFKKPRVTPEELNKLAAKILKNEMMGNTDMVVQLKATLERKREELEGQKQRDVQERQDANEKATAEDSSQTQEVMFTAPDRHGNVRPLAHMPNDGMATDSRSKRRKVESHDQEGRRTSYYQNDHKTSLADMVETERFRDGHDYDTELLNNVSNMNDDYDEDVFRPNMAKSKDQQLDRERHRAITAQQKLTSAITKCDFCMDNPVMPKHLMVSVGIKTVLMLPTGESMTPNQCLIVPMAHVVAINELDEDVQDEIKICKKYLTKMFNRIDMDCVFMETAMRFKRQRHAVLECVPMGREEGEIAPMCFKKAMNESMSEWGANKKIITTRNGAKCPIPKGFPYFHVEFGVDGGFANPIDNEEKFNHFFGKEIVGGMLDLEPRTWLKWHKESFEKQKRKVIEFSKLWQPFDWTQTLGDD